MNKAQAPRRQFRNDVIVVDETIVAENAHLLEPRRQGWTQGTRLSKCNEALNSNLPAHAFNGKQEGHSTAERVSCNNNLTSCRSESGDDRIKKRRYIFKKSSVASFPIKVYTGTCVEVCHDVVDFTEIRPAKRNIQPIVLLIKPRFCVAVLEKLHASRSASV